MEQFPPNSVKSKAPEPEEKKIERVTTSEPTRRKKGLAKQFQSTFFGGDFKSASNYVIFGVLIPAAKEALVEAGSAGFEKLIFGESKRRSSRFAPSMGHIAYNRMSQAPVKAMQYQTQELSRRARVQHDFDEIVLESRQEAETVLDQLYDLLSKYEEVTVSDLYELTGIKSTHVDKQWGWSNLKGSGVSRVRGGYLLDLPEPIHLVAY